MKLIAQVIHEKNQLLLVSQTYFSFINLLKNSLQKYEIKFFYSPKVPPNLQRFDYLILINPQLKELEKILDLNLPKCQRLICIFIKKSQQAKKIESQFKNVEKIKIIDSNQEIFQEKDIENILWFSLSKSKQNYLRLEIFNLKPTQKKIIKKKPFFHFLSFSLNRKKIFLILTVFIIIFHFLYLPFSALSLLINYKIFNQFKKEKYQQLENYILLNNQILKTGKSLYQIIRPTYLFFSLAIFPDNLFDILTALNQIYEKSYFSYLNSKNIINLFLKEEKNENEREKIIFLVKTLQQDLVVIESKLDTINYKVPKIFTEKSKDKIIFIKDLINKTRSILNFQEEIFAKGKEKKYLIFFANNRELRPGGGFIGSFATLTIENYHLKELKIYDVYDADGQLKIHVEPPMPIKKYLKIPHWYLRDSNFSPDFYENYQKAKFFLKEELNWENFDGAILITTSAIEAILDAFSNLYIPDFKETINSQNFFIKTQMYVEKNFFPGSIQKKTFLSSILRQVLINIENASFKKLAISLKKMLDEKQIVFYLENKNLQRLIDNFYYSGRIIQPKCSLIKQECINDYLFFYDANVGVNKADYFINRQIVYYLKINQDGSINQNLTIDYQNTSPSVVFPGGVYRNYFQVLIPKEAELIHITKNGVVIDDINTDSSLNFFKKIGFYFEVNPKSTVTIKINYYLPKKFQKGKQVYQLIIQKQIGAKNSDFVLNITLPKNISLINQNFIPLVNEKNIVYNSILDSDKIFFMEFQVN